MTQLTEQILSLDEAKKVEIINFLITDHLNRHPEFGVQLADLTIAEKKRLIKAIVNAF